MLRFHPTETKAARLRALLLRSLLFGLILITPHTSLATDLFHSAADNGIATSLVSDGLAQTVFLYIETGQGASAAGTACDSGAGDEICGYDLDLTGIGGLTILSFTPEPSADLVANLDSGVLEINGLDSVTPGPGAQRIGELTIDGVIGATLQVDAELVGADLSTETLTATTVVTVPEPRLAIVLWAGVLALIALQGRRTRITAAALGLAFAAAQTSAAPLVLNEFNAVASGEYLNGGTAGTDGDGNSIDPPSDPYLGRIAGNGGDWIELVVVGDHVDIRGWSLEICDDGSCSDTLTFSTNAVWSDLRAGTILTVSEDQPTDLSFSSGSGDWWMNVQAENGGPGTYITASNFPVSHRDWNLTIRDAQGQNVFGPLGEHVPQDPAAGCFPPQDDVNSGEIFRMEMSPSAIVDPCRISLNDWEDGVLSTFGAPNFWNSSTAVQDFSNLRGLIAAPDIDGDGIPDDGDLSGIAGDAPCVGGATANCDDNCPGIQNALQTDTGGPGGPDGLGDVCQCGDPSSDDLVTAADVTEIRELRVGTRTELTNPERCSVYSKGECSMADLVVLDRTLSDPLLEPGLAPTCQEAAVSDDISELMFTPERLLEINIRVDLADWDDLRVQRNFMLPLIFDPNCGNNPWPDPFTWFSGEVSVDGQTLTNVGVRKKGFQGSLSETEPSFKIKFDEFVGGQQLNGMDRLTLNNNNQDDSEIRSCLAYYVMRKAGVPAPRCNFAHVTVTTVNGPTEVTAVDKIYTHVDSIKDPFLRRNFGSDAGRLYEGTLTDFWSGPWRGTLEPKSAEAAADTTEVDALLAVLENPGLSDAARLAAIQGIIDYDDFLTFWAAEGLTGHWDGYADDQNNYWFYVDPADGLLRFIPWGPDATFTTGNPLPPRSGHPVHAEAIVPRAALTRRLYEIPSSKADFLAKLQDLLDNVFDEAELHAEINRIEALMAPITGDISASILPVRTWVDAHRALVQAEINSPPIGFAGQPLHVCDFF